MHFLFSCSPENLSHRKGTAIGLEDIINEARVRFAATPNSKSLLQLLIGADADMYVSDNLRGLKFFPGKYVHPPVSPL